MNWAAAPICPWQCNFLLPAAISAEQRVVQLAKAIRPCRLWVPLGEILQRCHPCQLLGMALRHRLCRACRQQDPSAAAALSLVWMPLRTSLLQSITNQVQLTLPCALHGGEGCVQMGSVVEIKMCVLLDNEHISAALSLLWLIILGAAAL